MKIYLVRHADYKNEYGELKGRLPVELSELGIKQCENLKAFFKDIPIDIIYSSEILRCKQTAEIISNKKISIKYDKRLLETLSAYQGLLNVSWNEHAYSHIDTLGGESVLDVTERIYDFYSEIVNSNQNSIVICSHGDPLFFLYLKIINAKINNDYLSLVNNYPEYQSKASVRLIEINERNLLSNSIIFEQN